MNLSPHPYSLRQIQYVIAVADALNFRQAALRCHVSQPALSAQIAALERALGVVLFERDRRRVLITAAGRDLIARAKRVLRESDDLVEWARTAGDPLAGVLRVGVIPTISPYLLPHLTPAIRVAHPRLTLQWTEAKTESLVGRLESGTLDAALLALEAELGRLAHEVIARDPFVLVAAPGDPLLARSQPAKPAELRGSHVLLLDDEHCFGRQALAVCTHARAHEQEFRATSLSTIAQMVAGGAGVTLLPQLAVSTEVRGTQLQARPFSDPAPARTIALVWRVRCPLERALRTLAATMRGAYPALQHTGNSGTPGGSPAHRG